MLELRNPHSVLAALAVRPRAVKSVSLNARTITEAWREVARVAEQHGIAVVASGAAGGSASGGRRPRGRQTTERSSTALAIVEPPAPVSLDRLWAADPEAGPGLWLALDQIQDPQNLGAIFRLAGFFGVRGILMTKDRSASLTATACDVAAGGAEYVPFSVVANLANAFEKARQNDIWMLGTCERTDQSVRQVRRDRHWMLVVGNEGDGLRRLTRERCDQLVAVPSHGPIPSLNVATATAACLAILTECGGDASDP